MRKTALHILSLAFTHTVETMAAGQNSALAPDTLKISGVGL